MSSVGKAIWYRRQRSVSEKELEHRKHRKKLEKDHEKKNKKEHREKRNISWFFGAFCGFCIMGGTLLSAVDIIFEDTAYSLIMVTIYGVSSTYIGGGIAVFTHFGLVIPGFILLISGALLLKYSYNLRAEKVGNWDLQILILSIIDTSMLILGMSIIMTQKSFFTTRVGYTASLNDMSMVLSLGFYIMLFGIILGFVAVGWNKLFKYRREKDKNVDRLEE